MESNFNGYLVNALIHQFINWHINSFKWLELKYFCPSTRQTKCTILSMKSVSKSFGLVSKKGESFLMKLHLLHQLVLTGAERTLTTSCRQRATWFWYKTSSFLSALAHLQQLSMCLYWHTQYHSITVHQKIFKQNKILAKRIWIWCF